MFYAFLILLLALILYVVAYNIYIYNRFIRLDNMVKEAWSDVNVQLKRRYTLIPNLVEIVKGYMKHESKTLKDIVAMRNSAMHRVTPAQKEEPENQITETLKHLFVVVENYPELKSSDQFRELSNNLVDIENTLQFARRYYNATVRNYNIALHSFPSNLLASFLKLADKNYFEIAPMETKNITVKLYEK